MANGTGVMMESSRSPRLPLEVIMNVVETAVLCDGGREILNLRLVCKVFDSIVRDVLYRPREIVDAEQGVQLKSVAETIQTTPGFQLAYPPHGTSLHLENNIRRYENPSLAGGAEPIAMILKTLFEYQPEEVDRQDEHVQRLAAMLITDREIPPAFLKRPFCSCAFDWEFPRLSGPGLIDRSKKFEDICWEAEVLRYAASIGMLDIVSEIVDQHESARRPLLLHRKGYLPCAFACAVLYQQHEVLEDLIAHVVDSRDCRSCRNEVDQVLRCGLHAAAATNNPEMLFSIMEALWPSNIIGPLNMPNSPLYVEIIQHAAAGGSAELIAFLLRWGRSRGNFRQLGGLKRLLVCGQARMLFRRPRSATEGFLDMILLIASLSGNTPVVQFALDGDNGKTALPDVIYADNPILHNHTSPLYRTQSPLMHACLNGYKEIIDILIGHGAGREARERQGSSPEWNSGLIRLAVEGGWLEVARKMIGYGIRPLLLPTLLRRAYARRDFDIIDLLLEMGATFQNDQEYWREEVNKAEWKGQFALATRLRTA